MHQETRTASCAQDRERGVVWEETIIFLPPASRMVFLSATLSNAGRAHARWLYAVMHCCGQVA